MPLATCPNCRNSLDVPPELLGGPVRCASCLSVFTAPKESVPIVPVYRSSVERGSDDAISAEPKPRSSHRWLWVYLLGFGLIFCSCLGSCAGLFGIMSRPAMKPYTSTDGRFTASFPGDPMPVSKTTNLGRDVNGVECQRDLPAEEKYFVEYVELTDDEKAKDATKQTADSLRAWMQDLGGDILETDTVDHKGLPGTQLFGQMGLLKGTVVARAIREDDRIYIVGVIGGVTPGNDRVTRFLDDFTPSSAPDKDKRIDPPAKGAKKKNPFKGNE